MIYGYIYKITNLVNNKVYIGQTISKNPKVRWVSHKHDIKRADYPLYNSMRKYGIDQFKFEVLFSCDGKFQLDEAEIRIISAYGSTNRNLGYNLGNGGNGKGKTSEESKLKNSLAHRGKPAWNKGTKCGTPRSEEVRKRISENLKETKRKLREAGHRNKPHTEEHKRKIGEKSKGRRHSEESKQKIREAAIEQHRRRRTDDLKRA